MSAYAGLSEQARSRNILWERGELDWKFHAGQKQIDKLFVDSFLERGTQILVAECSRQFGKSVWAVSKCIELCLQKRRARIRYGTAFFTDLEEFIRPAFDFVLEDCPEHLKPRYIEQKGEYRFPNGSVIKLVGLDRKPNGLRGNKLDLIVLDEAGYIARLKYLYQSVILHTMTHVPDARVIVISTQPTSPDHDFLAFCDGEFPGDDATPAEAIDRAYIKLTIYDNPLLTAERIEELERRAGGKHSIAWRREALCERLVDPKRALCIEWKPAFKKQTPLDKFFPFYRKLDSMDVGVKKDKTVCLFSYYDFRRAVLVVQDFIAQTGPSMRTDKLEQEIRMKEVELWGIRNERGELLLDEKGKPKRYPVAKRIVDNSDPLLAQDLSSIHHLPFICTDKDSLHAMVNLVKIWVKQGRLEVWPQCTELLGCLEKGIWNERRDEFAHSEIFGHYDAFAALVYLVRYVDQVIQHDNPIPDWFEREGTTKIFQKPKSDLSPMGEQFSDLLKPRKKHG